ncbi:MAG: hypothetical protein ABIR96_10300 [Bdellovibrionota bacterium]
MQTNPVLLLEINEVPWRIIDTYRTDFPHIDAFFKKAALWTSYCHDENELSPWVTWPTLHRGMTNTQHGVLNLGQAPQTFKGKAIWEELTARGLNVGVCGSLQSWPPTDPGRGGFFVPDTFAHDSRCLPDWVMPIQEFNLSQVAANGRVLDSKLGRFGDLLKLAPALLKALRFKTVFAIVKQLIGERLDRTKLSRRPIFQTILFWDVFLKLFDSKNPPALSTFFTNHIAGVMHRYWNHLYPGDFASPPKTLEQRETMHFAMSVLDGMLADVEGWTKKNPNLSVIFATSMGQAAIVRDDHSGIELSAECSELMRALGFAKEDFSPLLAMVPQIALETNSDETLRKIRRSLTSCKTRSNRDLFRVETQGSSLSITVLTPPLEDIEAGNFSCGDRTLTWAEAGIKKNMVDPGTAYHIPEGIFAVAGPAAAVFRPKQARALIDSDRIKEPLLAYISGEQPLLNEISTSVTLSP